MISATSSTTKLGDKRSYVEVAQAVWLINVVVPTCANYKLSYASNKFAQLDPASQHLPKSLPPARADGPFPATAGWDPRKTSARRGQVIRSISRKSDTEFGAQ